ncbi:hypothetical protein Pla123a_20000 [Posidoniimonas polymericola]|uniref:Ice-binding protein C-terminal domain-containing protein n=1 Tax=Posidoniimonas polymericola TaxID=2528002 RepID=A0A5C5YRJ1_9BACT|nr:PEP-CTERM sorting domain-containing protein [Posidoniimonas polymericola]TWT77340.1 hypothetical protein Pla123a_20000 [Posidoniimonas polymericola]
MKMRAHPTTFLIVLAAAAGATSAASAVLIREINGPDAASIQATVDAFRADLGAPNAPEPVNHPGGRREVNWDAAPDSVSDPNPFPGDFFNAGSFPRARGIEFLPTGETTGFELSSTAASGEPVEFGFDAGFTFFSAERLFTPIGGETFDVRFFDPANPGTPAFSTGLGVVFTDVESADSTTMTFYDAYDNVLLTRSVLEGDNAGLSFLGASFDEAIVARVSIVGGLDASDSVVMDDFIFGEPQAVPEPSSLAVLCLAAVGGIMGRRRAC